MASYYIPSEKKILDLVKFQESITLELKEEILQDSLINNEISLYIEKENILKVVDILENKYHFEQLIDITAVDYPAREKRFEVVYFFLSLSKNIRVKIKCSLEENDYIDSIYHFYSNANWLEREVYDMFGIYFKNHPDLRRILTDFGFEGHPLRKDFPAVGFSEVYFDEENQTIRYKKIELNQAYKDNNYNSPWFDDFADKAFNHIKSDIKE